MRPVILSAAKGVILSPSHVILSEAKDLLKGSLRVNSAKNLLLTLAMLLTLAKPVLAQTLASLIDRAPDGVVRLQVHSRPGVCGDGSDMIGYRDAIYGRNFQSMGGHWSAPRCAPGDLRVTVHKVDGDVTRLRTEVGGAWPRTEQRVTDLGVVDADEASAYFFTLVPRLERRDNDRILIPAVLADVAPPMQPLLSLARSNDRHMDTRRSAIHWIGLLGDVSVIPALVQFARSGSGDSDDKGMSAAATSALSMLDGDIGVPALIELARPGEGSVATRRNAVFWLGQNGDPRARRMLHSVIENTNEESKVRAHAVFSLTHGREAPEAEFAWLRGAYTRIREDNIKEQVLQGMTNDEEVPAGRWMIARALDADESMKLRRSALFWAGQRAETPTADLVRVYREAPETALKEHAIFVLSQRRDEGIEALLRIAREDGDTKMRSKALFWLGQSKDERARKLIADIVLRQP